MSPTESNLRESMDDLYYGVEFTIRAVGPTR